VHRTRGRGQPDIVLLDEPTSALDPISTAKIEELINELKSEYTIAIVTHNMQQAARISDFTRSCIWANSSSSTKPAPSSCSRQEAD